VNADRFERRASRVAKAVLLLILAAALWFGLLGRAHGAPLTCPEDANRDWTNGGICRPIDGWTPWRTPEWEGLR
jgi:hypothetical protein